MASRQAEHCPARSRPAPQLDALVGHDLRAVLEPPERIAQARERVRGGQWGTQALHARRDLVRHGRAGLEQRLERGTDAELGGVLPLAEDQRRRAAVEQRLQGLAQQERHLEAQAAHQTDVAAQVQGADAFCRRVQVGLADASFAQRRPLGELLIDRVRGTNHEVELR